MSPDTIPTDDSQAEDTVYLGNARLEKQLSQMEDIQQRGICFMCPEHLNEFYAQENGQYGSENGLMAEGKFGFLVRSGYPYRNTISHAMALPKAHVTRLNDLGDDFLQESFAWFRFLENAGRFSAGGVGMRFGKPAETGATVHHLHMHMIVPKPGLGAGDEPVGFYMSSIPKGENSETMLDIPQSNHDLELKFLTIEGRYGSLAPAKMPMNNTRYHLVATPKQAGDNLRNLGDEFVLETFRWFRSIETRWLITGGAIALRFGDPLGSGGTVPNLEIHYVVPKKVFTVSDPPIIFRLSPEFERGK